MDKIIKTGLIILTTIIILDIITFNINPEAEKIENTKQKIQKQLQDHFQNWQDPKYQDDHCSNKSRYVEKYVETELNLSCYLAYSKDHIWNIIRIDDNNYEFEATNLSFYPSSKNHEILDIRQGFYIQGIKMHYCYEI